LKKLLLFLVFLPLIVYGFGECPRFGTIQADIPCIQPSSWLPATGCDVNVSVYNSSGEIVLNTTWYDYTPFCAFNITNLTSPQTYCYNSTIENGCITLEREDNMLSITLIQIGLVIFFIAVGLPFKFGFLKFLSWGLASLEILITVWMIYIVESGNSIEGLLYINAISTLIIGGFLSIPAIIMLMGKMMVNHEKTVKDDGYTKFVFGDKWKVLH